MSENINKCTNNQEAKADQGKAKLTLVPRRIIFDIARIREYGNAKYPEGGKDNWKLVSKERYRDAAFRHFMAYLDDPEGCDEESGLPHLWHLACNIAFLCEMEDRSPELKNYMNIEKETFSNPILNTIEKAEAEANVKRTTAQANADALLIEAKAEAEANELLQKSLHESVLREQWIEKWNGVLPHYISGEQSSVMLSLENLKEEE